MKFARIYECMMINEKTTLSKLGVSTKQLKALYAQPEDNDMVVPSHDAKYEEVKSKKAASAIIKKSGMRTVVVAGVAKDGTLYTASGNWDDGKFSVSIVDTDGKLTRVDRGLNNINSALSLFKGVNTYYVADQRNSSAKSKSKYTKNRDAKVDDNVNTITLISNAISSQLTKEVRSYMDDIQTEIDKAVNNKQYAKAGYLTDGLTYDAKTSFWSDSEKKDADVTRILKSFLKDGSVENGILFVLNGESYSGYKNYDFVLGQNSVDTKKIRKVSVEVLKKLRGNISYFYGEVLKQANKAA